MPVHATPSLVIRAADLLAGDLAPHLDLRNRCYPHHPITPDQVRGDVQTRHEVLQAVDLAIELEGRPVGYGLLLNAVWFPGEGRQFVNLFVDPGLFGQGIEDALLADLLRRARERGGTRAYSYQVDRLPALVEALERAGFTRHSRLPVTAIELAGFDPRPYADLRARVASEGIRILSAAVLASEDSEWLRRYYDVSMGSAVDIPAPEPLQPMPYEVFVDMVQNGGSFDADGLFFALEGAEVVGLTELRRNRVDARIGNTGLTGVLRTHRRRGIGTALKVSALEWASSAGVERVYTDNDDRNPMLDLNLALGFREAHGILGYEFDLE